jgi:hypothetical protein
MMFGGVGYFRIGPQTGEFEVAIVVPFSGASGPTIVIPSGSLTFSLGPGQARVYDGCDPLEHHPFLPPPPPPNPWSYTCPSFTTGTHYKGTFPSSPELFADLLEGKGVFQVHTDSGELLSGSIFLAAKPGITVEKSGDAIILSWDDPALGLQQSSSLALDSWTFVPNGSTSPVMLPIGSEPKFFRLAPRY